MTGSVMTEEENDLDYLPEDTVGDQWRRDSAAPWETRLMDSSFSPAPLHESIAQLAYDFYLRRGRTVGHDLDDWLAAERIIHWRLAQTKNAPGDQFHATKE
jgi:hypothetical protein